MRENLIQSIKTIKRKTQGKLKKRRKISKKAKTRKSEGKMTNRIFDHTASNGCKRHVALLTILVYVRNTEIGKRLEVPWKMTR